MPPRAHRPGSASRPARGLAAAAALARRWPWAADGRLSGAIAPRFAVTVSLALLEGAASLAGGAGLLVHTHAAEQQDEVALVRARTGLANVEYLRRTGLASPRLCLAHCVWVDDPRARPDGRARREGAPAAAGSNLKLGWGRAGGRDAPPRHLGVAGRRWRACNNRLDIFAEMRLAATLQAMRRGPGTLTAGDALWMATPRAPGRSAWRPGSGQLTRASDADAIVVTRDRPHLPPATSRTAPSSMRRRPATWC